MAAKPVRFPALALSRSGSKGISHPQCRPFRPGALQDPRVSKGTRYTGFAADSTGTGRGATCARSIASARLPRTARRARVPAAAQCSIVPCGVCGKLRDRDRFDGRRRFAAFDTRAGRRNVAPKRQSCSFQQCQAMLSNPWCHNAERAQPLRLRTFFCPSAAACRFSFVAVRTVMSFRTSAFAFPALSGPLAGVAGVFRRSTRRDVRAVRP